MAKKQRLSGERRQTMMTKIRKRVEEVTLKDQREELSAANAALKARADKIAELAFPAADMAVLQKYKSTCTTNSLRVLANNPEDDQPAKHDEFVCSEQRLFPDDWNGRCAQIRLDDPIFELERVRDRLKSAFKEAVDAIMNDYRSVIYNMTYFEDVAEIIPEVKQWELDLYPASGAVSVLTRPLVERIRADQERLAA